MNQGLPATSWSPSGTPVSTLARSTSKAAFAAVGFAGSKLSWPEKRLNLPSTFDPHLLVGKVDGAALGQDLGIFDRLRRKGGERGREGKDGDAFQMSVLSGRAGQDADEDVVAVDEVVFQRRAERHGRRESHGEQQEFEAHMDGLQQVAERLVLCQQVG